METRDTGNKFTPAYITLLLNGELSSRVKKAWHAMENCDLCARYCHINRFKTIEGAVCRTGERAVVNSFGPHHGEERPLRGTHGSGTIFFSWCNLRCAFCQNWEISQKGMGREVEPEELAGMMLELQNRGCHNINFVTPSHAVAQIVAAVEIAAQRGLHVPLVYNTGGYDSPEALALLDGIIDIFMPDMKYGNSQLARDYSKVRDYFEINATAVREMHRQVGDLQLDEQGVAQRGLLIRHLVLPGHLANTDKVLEFIAHELSPDTCLNLMDQYHPCYRAGDHPPLDRRLTMHEYQQAQAIAKQYGLTRLDKQH
jgi:putative pyruvate formate lyase activating enzyme